ncbi:MAG TPA: hypothetical protein EYP04_11755 [Anaerolineae bacterium]|nr:hypothetical protein [Anaerolineae bacterium]
MNERDKLRVLLPHWIEHNAEHADEFRRWAEQAGEAKSDILAAAEQMQQVNARLTSALEKLGGALPLEQHKH